MSSSIAEIQEKKEAEILQKYRTTQDSNLQHRESDAAKTLQRTYRGHKARRQLQGLSLDPTTRWTEAIKEAQYRNLTSPRSRTFPPQSPTTNDGTANSPVHRVSSLAHDQWSRAGKIARRANTIEDSSVSSSSSSLSDRSPDSLKQSLTTTSNQKKHREQKRLSMKGKREQSAKMMDLSYFLEMVDVKHRYGSNLRKYHAEWQSHPTRENFFYWLDHGEGVGVDLPHCSRARLESMQVRYLGREERRLYEVVVDEKGKLVWRKDGLRVDTTPAWRDSVRGIVLVGSDEPEWAHDRPGWARGSSESSGVDSDEEREETKVDAMAGARPGLKEIPIRAVDNAGLEEGEKTDHIEKTLTSTPEQPTSPTQERQDQKRHFSFHNLIKKSTNGNQEPPTTESHQHQKEPQKHKHNKQDKQTWIFLMDTKTNLYIGLKSSGAFQHSSFLHGSRVSAAGTISVRDGQLRLLQPRSGHYKTSGRNLRLCIEALRERGVDMSVGAVGGSYVAMMGIETFMGVRGGLRGLKKGGKQKGKSRKGDLVRRGG